MLTLHQPKTVSKPITYFLSFHFWLFLAGLLLLSSFSVNANETSFRFTGDPNWMPFEAFDQNQRYIGIVSDVLNDIVSRSDLSVQYMVSKDWPDALNMARRGEVDVISGDLSDDQIKQTHVFTTPYLESPLVVTAKEETPLGLTDLAQFADQRIGIIAGYGYTWELKDHYPDIDFIEVENIQHGLLALMQGELDMMISTEISAKYHLRKLDLRGVHIIGKLPIYMRIGFAVSKDRPALLASFNRALNTLPQDTLNTTIETWTTAKQDALATSKYRYVLFVFSGLIALLLLWQLYNWRKHSQLQKNAQKLTRAMLASRAGVWQYNFSENKFDFSPEFFAIFGYEHNQLPESESDWLRLIHPEDIGHYLQEGFRQLTPNDDKSTPHECRFRLLDRDGEAHWVRMSGDITSWKQGQPRQAAGTLENIHSLITSETALQEAQKSVEQRELLLTTLIDSLPDLIWFKDRQGRYVDCNASYAHFFGIDRDAIKTKTDAELELDDQAMLYAREDREVLITEQALNAERWVKNTQTNQSRLLHIQKLPINREDIQLEGILGVARDITDQHRLFDALNRFKSFAENSGQGFAMASLDGQLYYLNPALLTMLGLDDTPKGEQATLSRLYPSNVHAELQEHILPCVIESGNWSGKLQQQREDGSQFPSFENFFLLNDQTGKASLIGVVITDITDQQSAEQALETAREAAEQANKTKTTFLANMSHEIRTPLNAIIGYSQLLVKDNSINSTAKTRLNAILNAGDRLLGLINDILDITKIEADNITLHPQLVNLRNEVQSIAHLMQERTESKGLRFIIENYLMDDDHVQVDSVKLGQVLINLLGNAIKFTEEGNVRLTVRRSGDQVHFTVADTGPGISEAQQRELFKPFSQGDASLKAGGTGLGLALSKKLVELMSGKISLYSEPDQGTQVEFSLPLTLIESQLDTPISITEETNVKLIAPRQVLIVEDDEWSRDLLRSLLESVGCEVQEASDGLQALARYAAHQPDIVMTDIRMPNLNGIQLFQQLRTDYPDHTVPIVAVTASSLDHERTELLEKGFLQVIGKPYKLNEIYSALKRHTGAEFQELETADPALLNSAPSEIHSMSTAKHLMESLRDAAVVGDMSKVTSIASDFTAGCEDTDLRSHIEQAVEALDFSLLEQLAAGFLQTSDQA